MEGLGGTFFVLVVVGGLIVLLAVLVHRPKPRIGYRMVRYDHATGELRDVTPPWATTSTEMMEEEARSEESS